MTFLQTGMNVMSQLISIAYFLYSAEHIKKYELQPVSTRSSEENFEF